MSNVQRMSRLVIALLLVCAAIIAGCGTSGGVSQPPSMREIHAGSLGGYLPTSALPNSVTLLPPPPEAGSVAFALDEEIAKKSFELRGTARWTLAKQDADLTFPQAAGIFSCALNAPITEQETPHLYLLLRRTLSDAAHATHAAKEHYKRVRPFVINKQPICTPDEEKEMAESGSYPSGHAAIGWAWALILTEISPGQTDAILARGRAYGESRVICNVHWQSDVIESVFVGAGTVARLHADEAFLADLEAAKAELTAVRLKGLKPLRNCTFETEAIADERRRSGNHVN
jgi:acid phosphatase (class A)